MWPVTAATTMLQRLTTLQLLVCLAMHAICIVQLCMLLWSVAQSMLPSGPVVAHAPPHRVVSGPPIEAPAAMPTLLLDHAPGVAYVLYLVAVLVHTRWCYPMGDGVVASVGAAAALRLLLCMVIIAWRGGSGHALFPQRSSVVGSGVVSGEAPHPNASDTDLAVWLLDLASVFIVVVAALLDAHVLFDGVVGVADISAPIGVERCVVCGEQWDQQRGQGTQHRELDRGAEAALLLHHNMASHDCRPLLKLMRREGGGGCSRSVGGGYGGTTTDGGVAEPLFLGVESVGRVSRWTFSWVNPFLHYGYRNGSVVFEDPHVAAVAIPALPSFMTSLFNYTMPAIQLWRLRRRVGYGGAASDKDGAESDGGGGSQRRCCSSLCGALLWPVRALVLRPLSLIGQWLFLRFFVDAATRAELQDPSYRSLYTLFLETSGGKRFVNRCVPLKLAQDVLAMSSPVLVSYLIHLIKDLNLAEHNLAAMQSGMLPNAAAKGNTTDTIDVTGVEEAMNATLLRGVLICCVMFVVLVAQSLFFQNYLRHLYLSATEATTSLRAILFEKVLVTPSTFLLSKGIAAPAPPAVGGPGTSPSSAAGATQAVSEGVVVSLMTVDAARCGETLVFLHNAWGHPLMVVASVALLVYYVGVAAAAASLVSLVLMLPVNRSRSHAVQVAQRQAVGSGPRVSLCNEILSNMRLVKASVWEGTLLHRIVNLRREESKCEEVILQAESYATVASDAGAILVCVACFTAYYFAGGPLVAETLVPALAALNLLRFPMWSFPSLLSTINRGIASMRRVDGFLGWSRESAAMAFAGCTRVGAHALPAGSVECVVPTTFSYTKATLPQQQQAHGDARESGFDVPLTPNRRKPSLASPTTSARDRCALENVVLRIVPGELVVVRGGVGSGKTTLLYAMLGELPAAPSVGPSTINTFTLAARLARRGSQRQLRSQTSMSELDAMDNSNVTSPTRGPSSPRSPARPAAPSSSSSACGFRVGGTVAYCSEAPWLRHESIRRNICMHLPYDASWYRTVVAACALEADLLRLPLGDATLVGDKGVQLSGGQRARVALARAVYGNYDCYLLDGVLDALDGASRATIEKHVLRGLLKRKTRVVVSHMSFEGAAAVDRVFDVRSDGNVVEVAVSGLHQQRHAQLAEAVAAEDACATPESTTSTQEGGRDAGAGWLESPPSSPSQHPSPTDRLPTAIPTSGVVPPSHATQHALGRAKLPRTGTESFAAYLRCFGWNGALVVLTSCLYQILQTSMDVWLGFWISRRTTTGIVFLAMYALLGLATAVVSFVRTTVFFKSCVAVANRLVVQTIHRLMMAPVSYFDTTSTGTLSTILSKDVDVLDRSVPESIQNLLRTCLQLMAIAAFNSALSPMFLFVIPLTVSLFFNVSMRFLRVSKEVRKLENRSIGGVVSILKEAFQGGPTIRCDAAYGDAMRLEFCDALDVGNRARDVAEQLDRWVGLRLELVSTILATTAAFLSVFYSARIPPAFAGVAVVNCLNTSRILVMLCRRIGMFQVQFMSIEQVMKLLHVPQEPEVLAVRAVHPAPALTLCPLDAAHDDNDNGHRRADDDNAISGLDLHHVRLQYRTGSAGCATGVTLNDVCLHNIPQGCIVGLAGRSGAGKSSLFNAILGLADRIDAERIAIGGMDVTDHRRKDVRRMCLVIPQDPPMLRGTWRSNLRLGTTATTTVPMRSIHDLLAFRATYEWGDDGADEGVATGSYTSKEYKTRDEARMWWAIEKTGLAHKLSPLLGLDTAMEEGGGNFSAGEKQLFCMARALMRDPPPRLVLLDEVTARVDDATDHKVHALIRSQFVALGCTVLMIAHRQASLDRCDMVVTMADGSVVQAVPPRMWHSAAASKR